MAVDGWEGIRASPYGMNMKQSEVGGQNTKADLMVISGIGGDLIKLRLDIAAEKKSSTR